MQDNLRYVLISGASTGIGFCCAHMLADAGYHVLAGFRKSEDADRLVALSPHVVPVSLDITQPASLKVACRAIERQVGEHGLAGLVNNAGMVVGGPSEFVPLDALRLQLEVNLIGHVGLTQAMLPLLRQARGRIVNMGSVAGLAALPFVSPYSISKFALEAWTDALRVELHPWGIEVAIIEPGSIATPIWEKSMALAEDLSRTVSPRLFELYGDALEAVREASRRSAKNGIPPEQVARAVLHALSARQPRTRYLIGRDAHLRRLFKVLPDRWKDALIRRKLGLESSPSAFNEAQSSGLAPGSGDP